MKRKLSTRFLALLCIVPLLFSGCTEEKKQGPPNLITQSISSEPVYTFGTISSDPLVLSDESANAVLQLLQDIHPDYFCSPYYQMDEVKNRLSFDATVDTHQYCALNDSGILDAGHLAEIVKNNNAVFLADDPFGYKNVEPDFIEDLCEFIVYTVQQMLTKYPDIDQQRIYCNLGNLKILYDVGMLSFAEVSPDMILSISQNNTGIILNIKGEDGFTRVLTHEIMHILQIGCVCEPFPDGCRRAGIAVYWDDFLLNTTDWTWFVEGSAERNMCTLTGRDAVTYQYKMDYICSMTMSLLLRDSIQPDTLETLCFYDDPQRLFDAFGCKTEEERDELLNLMITLQILQMQPTAFYDAYKDATGINLQADEETLNAFSYSLKPAVCTTLAKEFYENLISYIQSASLTYTDLFFLINLFEGHLNPHLNYTNAEKDTINRPFMESYTKIRSALFTVLEKDNPDIPFSTLYGEYDICAAGNGVLNAELKMLSSEKKAFLAERAQWQKDLMSLGTKVPELP